jgi:membrane fusion protein (multidrug efflux system)
LARLAARWPWAAAIAVVVGFVTVAAWRIFAPTPDIWTDDSYVRVHYATIAPRVAGQIDSVRADNNDMVKAGEVLAELDNRDFSTAVATATAMLARDQALVDDAAAAVLRQGPVIEQAKTQVTAAAAQLSFAQAEVTRYNRLASAGAAAIEDQQQRATALRKDQAALDGAQAALNAAQAELQILQAQAEAARAMVGVDTARLQQAKLNLSYTKIRAPVDGMVAERSVEVGNYVGPGAALMAVVPLSQIYIEANYREVALRHVQAGQSVRIHVDAYDIDLKGTVVGVPAATGTTFAALEPDDATGNFTKIVQRLPVRIIVAPNQPLARLLRVGMSVETTIHTGIVRMPVQEVHPAA